MNSKKNLKRNLLICLLAGSAVMYTLPLHAATSVIGNNTLPSGGQFVHGEGNIASSGLEMNITQNGQNAVIKWNDFSVGGNATVNFDYTGKDNFNTLNYVNSGKVSQIYGTINAQHEGYNGNIFIVNTAGVQIGPSAQINVGSLHVSNKYLNESELGDFAGKITPEMINTGKNADAVLMSLGNINAGEVTFEGNGRIVIDSERIKDEAGNDKLGYKNINITTSADNTDNIIIGYDGYDATIDKDTGKAIGYAGANGNTEKDRLVTINGNDYFTKADGYMWVEDVEQLQAINTNLSGNYALRNSIDATGTTNWSDPEVDGKNEGFLPIGIHNDGKVYETTVDGETKYGFYGNFDGVDYNIFGLTINREDTNNVGLFGVAHDANINNVTLVGGSITGGSVVGSVVGAALGNTHITNATNSASVTGNADVGGIVGYSGNKISDGDNGNINVSDTDSHFTNLINTGAVYSKGESDGKTDTISNTGGLIGYMYNGTLDGNSYNLGDVSGKGYNVGGLVGHAVNSTIGDGTNLVYNRLDVEGKYNVGGIVGNMDGTTVQNAENSGNITATGFMTGKYYYHTANGGTHIAKVDVNVANVGGIAGKADDTVKADGTVDKKSEIKNVTNSGNVSSSKQAGNDYYDAGNVGGIVGSAVDTDITNATNKENEVRGAHNVGGVAGYFGNSNVNNNIKYTINRGINDGGDIMATGARFNNNFVKEIIRPASDRQTEEFIIGNIGGVVGYMDGDNVYVTGSANRGTVHTSEPNDPKNVQDYEKAANVGGIVGKIDRSDTLELSDLNGEKGKITNAAVSNSYNTGDVLGYTGVGGVVGMMYNGEVAGSYNLGHITTTRQSSVGVNSIDSLNMGGIVGDTTENSDAEALLYDVYNKGQIGDEEFEYFGRHVGGIVGRLSGDIEKAYNTGAIYNGYSVVGGIAGWVFKGNINNSFNTGNITVYNQNSHSSQVGGIAGAAQGGNGIFINNVYNLGTLRSFDVGYGNNSVGGILGTATQAGTVTINNAYTTGNLYSGKLDKQTNTFKEDLKIVETYKDGNLTGVNTKINSIYGSYEYNASVVVGDYTYYIQPDNDENGNPLFTKLTGRHDLARHSVEFSNKSDYEYEFDGGITEPTGGDVDENSAWRIYDGNTPILNAFLPKAEDYFSGESGKTGTMEGITSIQYGTAYDPLLTIIKADKEYLTDNNLTDLSYKWTDLGINNAAGIAVYGAGLTLSGFEATGGTGYFGGTVYADGALTLNGGTNDINLGSAAQIYGSAVNIDTKGKVTIYGDVIATGNNANGATVDETDKITVNNTGNISINAGDVDVYGTLTTGKNVSVPGIEDQAVNTWTPGDVDNPYAEMVDIADRFAHETTNSNVNGNINITANGTADGSGNVNLYFGNKEEGLITTGGNLEVTGTGDVYVDSDLEVGKNMTITSTGKDGEVLLTLTNIGKVQANKFVDVIESAINGKDIKNLTVNDIKEAVDKVYPELHFTEDQAELIIASLKQGSNKTDSINKLKDDISVAYMHDFMHSFEKPQPNTGDVGYKIALNAASGEAKLTVDMWEEDVDNTGKSGFDYTKYDTTFPGTSDKHTFKDELDNLNFIITNTTTNKIITDASKAVYVEVSTGEQLKAIQQAGDSALGYNYALMGDINASDVENYVAIGTGNTDGFTGTFDGRGNRIIGLNVSSDNAGIFSEIGTRNETINGEKVTYTGTVKNVNIYSGNFEGKNTAGAVAGENNGRIENIITFGNTVTSDGKAGGIVGVNKGDKGNIITNEDGTITLEPAENEQFATGIIDVESIGSVIAKGDNAVAGGLVGTNEGALGNSYSDSAVTSTFVNNQAGLGGVVGVNTEKGNVQYVDSLGVTNGGTTGSSNVGGLIGINKGNMYSGYNESIVSGNDYVGGIIGQNTGKYESDKWNGGTVENVVNATGVTGSSNYVGGLVGTNTGSVTNGRNNGTIAGTNYVGGLVGDNADEHSILTNLVNDSSAEILGVEYVGGIAGKNRGTITADRENNNLINRGSITGHKYVGGVAGLNVGTITNTNIDVELKVNNAVSGDHQYFGGIVGQNGDDKNEGTIENATNSNKIVAPNASYVGGIVGWNTQKGKLIGMGNSNEGEVIGGSYVGGVIGKNDAAIGSKNAAQVGIKNEGVVIATNGGAGGLIGENNAAITNTIMTNKGEVHGNNSNDGSGTGGLIGTNSGAISYSSMTNEVTGTVTGVYNVGGLIGVNKADITGGRDTVNDKDSGYYLNKIYNNGVINVGNYTDADKDGKYEFAASNGQNIGGLFGTNSGKVEAAYNTGAINASGSTNVGGIAGVNEQGGKLDQVFNTVMTENGTGAISGGTNVGGLVGTNSGTLSNAYNTAEVKSTNNGVVGNAVGVNTNKVENIYGYSELVGNGNEATKSYVINNSDEWKQQEKYIGFDFTTSDNTPAIWKNYDGYSNPLLKVFLTKAQYNGDTEFTYNATEQGLTISSNTIINAADKLDAYNNANSLLTATQNKNAGKDYLGIYSQQIAASGKGDAFDPNNLGYDIDVTYDIEKAQLNITLDDVHRTYGNTTITSGGYTIDSISGWKGEDAILADGVTISASNNKNSFAETDTALTGSNTGKVTENAGGQYTWSADVTLSEEIAQNYEITTTTLTGNSYVGKAKLTININDVTMTYGDKESTISNQYGYTVNNGLVNGDSLKDVIADMTYENTAYNADGTTKDVIDGKYALENKDITVGGKYGNYEVTINNGTVMMNKADLNIKVDNANTTVGKMPGELTGTVEGLTNGDTLPTHDFALKDDSLISVSGNHEDVIGIVIGGKFYELGDADWSNGLFANYDVNYEMGDLAVSVVEIPDNWPNNRWDYLFGDNPFDRNENFLERKAEVNFVDGAMEI